MEMHGPQPLGRAEVTSLFVTLGSKPQSATCDCIRFCDSGGGAAAGSKPKLQVNWLAVSCGLPLTCKAIVCYVILALVLAMGGGDDGVGKDGPSHLTLLPDSGGQF